MKRSHLLGAAFTLASGVASVGAGQSVSVYGDKDRDFDGPATVDAMAAYSPPAAFVTWLEAIGYPISATDIHNNNVPRTYPFILNQHAGFDAGQISWASLRFQVFHDPDHSNPRTDTIDFWDEQNVAGIAVTRYSFGERLVPLLEARSEVFEQTIEIEINLLSGQARAWRIRWDGHPPVSLGLLGPAWGGIAGDLGGPADVIDLARDGSLYGAFQDDMELFSYAELIVDAERSCPGDLDGDYDVDLADLTMFLSTFGSICY